MADERDYVRLVWTIRKLTNDEARQLVPELSKQAGELLASWEREVGPQRAAGDTKATATAEVFVSDSLADVVGSKPLGDAAPATSGGSKGSGG